MGWYGVNFQEVQGLFPSEDGNKERQHEFLSLIEKLIVGIDEMKDPNRVTLGDAKDRNDEFYNSMMSQEVPKRGVGMETVLQELLGLAKGHPYQTRNYLTNTIPVASMAGVLGMMTAALINSNTIWDVYGPAACEAEAKINTMMARIVGYDPDKSWGYTTWGGQGAVYAALRIAIAKQLPFVKEEGVTGNLYTFASEGSHFSLLKSVEATGVGSNRLIAIRTRPDHSMDPEDLRIKMEDVVRRGGIPTCVVATVGTTDGFGLDDVEEVKNVTTYIEEKFNLKPIHIHADTAMGGFFAVFNEYDFLNNPLKFEDEVLVSLESVADKMRKIAIADSACFDFHKLGQTPYVTTLFLLKNGKDLKTVDLKELDTPYIGNRSYGSYHTSYTLECSRQASSISIYAALLAFGVEGYQQLLGNYVRVNLAFRKKLTERIPNVAVANSECYGPITLFRLYPSQVEWDLELAGQATIEQVETNNEWTYELFERLGQDRQHFFFGDTKKLCLVDVVDAKNRYPIYAVKFTTISPYTEVQHVDAFVDHLEYHINQILSMNSVSNPL